MKSRYIKTYRRSFIIGLLLFTSCRYTGFEPYLQITDQELSSLKDKTPYPEYTSTSERALPARVEISSEGVTTVKISLPEAIDLAL
jgi:hypothetical protein